MRPIRQTRLIRFDEACRIMLEAVAPLPAETVPLSDALSRVSAEDVIADTDLVPYARSAMDGYAVRAGDTQGASCEHRLRLPVVGQVFAGAGEAVLIPGTAIAITTGAPIPLGADAVIACELVHRSDDRITLEAAAQPGQSIFPPAEDVHRGDLLVQRGDLLKPATLALLAFTGRAQAVVHRRPLVGVCCTGSELVDVSAVPGHGQIRNTNAFTIQALVTQCGGVARYCGTAPDDPKALRAILELAWENTDLIITTGGASVGERDLVKSVLTDLGAEFRFSSVAVRPGKPTALAIWRGVPVCVLPGNPGAAFVAFQEFVRPAILKLAGRRSTALPILHARLKAPVKSKPGHRYIVLAELKLGGDGLDVTPLKNQCSVLVRTAAEANSLILLPEGPQHFEPGETVEVQALDWPAS